MSDYLTEIRHAAVLLIEGVWHEQREIERLRPEIEKLERHVEGEYVAAEAMQATAESADELMMGAGRYWENYFGADKERYEKDAQLSQVEQMAAAHTFSIGSLAGSLLQHAKQGISLVHAGLSACPAGRVAGGGVTLRDVIWQGRNQAMHWDEGHFRPAVINCFNLLVAHDSRFRNYTTRNCAFDIVDLLGWRTIDAFVADLTSLA